MTSSSTDRPRRLRMPTWVRTRRAELEEAVGFVAVVAGVAMWSIPAAFITGGVGLISVSYTRDNGEE